METMGREEALAALCGDEAAWGFAGLGKVLVVGPTGVGKSTFARDLAERMGTVRHVEASGWMQGRVEVPDGTPGGERARIMAERAMTILAGDPGAPARWVRAQANCCGGGMVVSGLRNPRDFAALFEPTTDVLVVLQRAGFEACTAFERGVDVVEAHGAWASEAWAGRRSCPLPALLRVDLDKEVVP